MNSCLIIAGEKSGEEHALSFFKTLKDRNPDCHFFGVGGDELFENGLELLYHLNDFSTWGYSEVLAKIPFYKKAMDDILENVKKRNCKTAILIDFQSFNMKLAQKLTELGVRVLYVVAPQAWAWKEYRVNKLKKIVHTLFTIIPFEKKWFMDRGVQNVVGIPHPQLEIHKKDLSKLNRQDFNPKKVKLLLLPGSRNFEVESLLPEFISALDLLSFHFELGIVKSTSVRPELYTGFDHLFDHKFSNLELKEALEWGDFALAASGTVTLSCALFELPTIVTYKTSFLNYFIYETFVSYSGPISLANIVHNHSVFPELIQDRVSSFNIASQLNLWYHNTSDYNNLRLMLKKTKNLVEGDGTDFVSYLESVLKIG
jgi:lipid-A-disaccharide synthase